MSAPQSNDPASRPYKVVTEVEEHACPSCKARWEMHHDQYCDYEPADRTGHFGGGLPPKASGEHE